MFKKIHYIFNKRQRRNVVILFFLLFIGSFVELLGVSAISPLINLISDESVLDTKWYYRVVGDLFGIETVRDYAFFFVVALIVIYVLKNAYICMEYNFQYRFTYNNQSKLYIRMMKNYMKQDYLYHVGVNVADLERNITADTNQLFSAVSALLSLIGEILVCLFLVTYLAIQDLVSTLASAGILLVFLGIFLAVYKKLSSELGRKSRLTMAVQVKWLLQSFAGIKEIKVSNKEKFFVEQFSESTTKHLNYYRKQSYVSSLSKPVMETVCICGLLFVIGLRVAGGTDLKELLPFLTVLVIAAFRMLPSFNRISGFASTILFAKPAVDNVYNEIRRMEEGDGDHMATEDDGFRFDGRTGITIDNLSFRYPEGERNVLDGVSFEIPRNASVALIGSSGSGKTTLADLILGVLNPTGGRILVDDTNVFDHLYGWHEKLSYIPQTIYLMDDTIRRNVAFGIADKEISEEQIWSALRQAQLEEFVKSLPDGLDTQVGDRGVKLSGGQRQRIGIARALYRQPSILILDEATSALDNETETAVMEAIDSLQGSLTMVVIAHRLSTIRNCDYIYEVGGGRVTLRDKSEVLG